MIPSSRFSSAFLAASSTSALVAARSQRGGLSPSEQRGFPGSIATKRPRIGFPGLRPMRSPPLRPGSAHERGISWLSLASRDLIED